MITTSITFTESCTSTGAHPPDDMYVLELLGVIRPSKLQGHGLHNAIIASNFVLTGGGKSGTLGR